MAAAATGAFGVVMTPSAPLTMSPKACVTERVPALLGERELDPAALRRREVDRLRVVADRALDDGQSNTVPITWKALQMLGPALSTYMRTFSPLDRDRVVLVLVRVAVERDHVGLYRPHLGHVGVLAGLAEVVLLLRDPQLLVDRREVLRLDHEHADHPGARVHQHRLGRAVVHEHAGVLGLEAVVHRLAGREVGVALAGVDLGGVEVERVIDLHALVGAVDEREVDGVALGDDHRGGHAGAAVVDAVDGEAPHLGRGEVLRDLRDVLVDVDLERLDRARRRGRQLRVDGGELLERDALGVGERRRGGGGGRAGAGVAAGVAVARRRPAPWSHRRRRGRRSPRARR